MKMKSFFKFLCLILFSFSPVEAFAQATAAGITPCSTGGSLSVSVASSNTQLSTCGTTAVVWNTGTVEAFVNWGTTSTTAATLTGWSIPGGTAITLNTGRAGLYLAAITSSGTTTLRVVQGNGMPAIAGGSGGSGGASSGLSFVTATLSGWTSATALNATQTLMPITSSYGAAVLVQLDQTSTISAGAVTFEGTYDGTNWVSVPVAQILNPNTFANLTNPYTLVASTNQPFMILSQGYQGLRIKLSTQITGSATVTPFVALLPYLPVDPALLAPLAAGTAIIGKVGIDQSSPGTTNAVQAIPGISGGLSWYFVQPAASDNHVVIKAGAGQVYHISATNNSATINYLRLYNATTGFNGCNSATNIVGQWAIPASTSGAGIVVPIDAAGIAFSTGISICVSSGYATTDTTNATASAMSVNVGYK